MAEPSAGTGVSAVVRGPPRGWRWTIQRALFVVPLVLFALAGWAQRWIVDDGFIYLRVVQQVMAGNGPVFNEGDRVETFTSPAWVAVLSVADLVAPVRLEWLVVGAGIALSVAGLGLMMAGAATLARRSDPDALLVPFGALVLLALIPVWIFETSGLESGLVLGWLGACLFVLARWARSTRPMPWYAAALGGLGWLVRPELVVFSAVFVLAVLAVEWSRQSWSGRLRFVAAAVALPVLYQLFRMGYYGMVVSNPAIAKEASNTNWERGWDYFIDLTGPYWLWVPAAVLAVGGYLPLVTGLRRAGGSRALAVIGIFVMGGALDALYIIAVGGDWMHARLLLPALFALVAPVAMIPCTRRHAAAALVVPWAVVAAVALRPPQLDPEATILDQFILADAGDHEITIEDHGWGANSPGRQWYSGPDAYMWNGFEGCCRSIDLDRTRSSVSLPTLVTGGIGTRSYALGPEWHIIDLAGLASTLDAHMVSTPTRGFFPRKPGHEKPFPAVWVAAVLTPSGTRVDPSIFPEPSNPAIPQTTGHRFQEQVAWARAALECPDIADLVEFAREPLGPRRALSNVARSFDRTFLRIPPDPETAYHEFCGPETPDEVRALTRATNASNT